MHSINYAAQKIIKFLNTFLFLIKVINDAYFYSSITGSS